MTNIEILSFDISILSLRLVLRAIGFSMKNPLVIIEWIQYNMVNWLIWINKKHPLTHLQSVKSGKYLCQTIICIFSISGYCDREFKYYYSTGFDLFTINLKNLYNIYPDIELSTIITAIMYLIHAPNQPTFLPMTQGSVFNKYPRYQSSWRRR